MSYNYWLDEVGLISRESLKEIIQNPKNGFTGFMRFSNRDAGAFGFVFLNRKTVKLSIYCQL